MNVGDEGTRNQRGGKLEKREEDEKGSSERGHSLLLSSSYKITNLFRSYFSLQTGRCCQGLCEFHLD